MNDDSDLDSLSRIGLASALNREYLADERAFLGFLAPALEHAFGSSIEIGYAGGFLSKKHVVSLTLTHGDYKYTLEDTGHGPLQAKVTHAVRGIALKSERIDVLAFLHAISEIAELEAKEHASTSAALQKLLGLS